MKKHLFTFLMAVTVVFTAQAQQVSKTVSVGASYANQVWYSLQNDQQGTAPKNNWDIAFEISGFSSALLTNSVIGTELWAHPTADTTNWASLDTTGIRTWNKLYNSDTTWTIGAFNKAAVASNPFDLGWGIYNMTTHQIAGNRLFVIKLANGEYQKLWIKKLVSGTYVFRHARLNNTGDVTKSLAKSGFTGKNFAYYSLQTQTTLDREPVSASWDLIFAQYTTFIPSAYTVTGVLANSGVTVAKVHPVNNPATYANYQAHTFSSRINTLGYNWKALNMATMAFVMEDSTVFFVKDKSKATWRVVFTGFGGSANGNYIFTQEKLAGPTGTKEELAKQGSFAVYPNPVSGNSTVQLMLDMPAGISQAQVVVTDLNGRTVKIEELNNISGFSTQALELKNLAAGTYIVNLVHEQGRLVKKLIVY